MRNETKGIFWEIKEENIWNQKFLILYTFQTSEFRGAHLCVLLMPEFSQVLFILEQHEGSRP